MLSFCSDLLGHPPNARVVEQEGLGQRLGNIDDVVVPPDVGQLVCQDRFDLRRTQVGERRNREQDDGLQPADGGRRLDERGFDNVDNPVDVKSGGYPVTRRLPTRQRHGERPYVQVAHSPQPTRHADKKRHDDRQPAEDHDRQHCVHASPEAAQERGVVGHSATQRWRHDLGR